MKICDKDIDWVCSTINNFKVIIQPDELLVNRNDEITFLEIDIKVFCQGSGKLGSEFVLIEGPVHEFYILQAILQKELINSEM